VSQEENQDQMKLLTEARVKASRLLDGLLKEQAELKKNPPKVKPADRILGEQAMANAIASARRMIVALEEAAKIGKTMEQEDQDERDGNKRP
jgi:hypothetical protein